MKFKIKYGYLFLLCFPFVGISAMEATADTARQTNELKPKYATYSARDNWFLSGGVGLQGLLTSGHRDLRKTQWVAPMGKLSFGRWFSPYSAIRANVNAGYLHMQGENKIGKDIIHAGIGLDYMFNLSALCCSYKEDRLFEVLGIIGVGYDHLFQRTLFRNSNLFAINIGAQAKFNVSPNIDIFIEPMFKFTSDLFDGSRGGQADIVGGALVGVTYKFGKNRFKSFVPQQHEVIDIEKLRVRTEQLRDSLRIVQQQNGNVKEEDQKLLYGIELPVPGRKAYYNTSFWDNTFVSLGGIAEIRMQRLAKGESLMDRVSPGISLSAGKWIHPLFGLQLNVNGVHIRSVANTFNYASASFEFLYNFSADVCQYNPKRIFSLIPLGGIGWAQNRNNGKSGGSFQFTAGLQGKFYISSYIDLFLEGRAFLVSDRFDTSVQGNWYDGFGSLRLGVIYKLRGNSFKVYDFANARYAEVLNDRINQLREKLETEKLKPLAGYVDYSFYKEPQQKGSFVYIKFAPYSSYLDSEQRKSIDIIGRWMKENPQFKIRIIAFSDPVTDRNDEKSMEIKRSKSIAGLLIDEYKVNQSLIEILSPEQAGYDKKSDSGAIIEFLPF